MMRISQSHGVEGLSASSTQSAGDLNLPESCVAKRQRSLIKDQKPYCIWFTGLSGAGKTTIAGLLEQKLHSLGRHTYLLDGDRVRNDLCADLDFSNEGRCEQMRRVGEVARLMLDAGLIVIVAVIAPFRRERERIRSRFEPGEFVEIFVDTPLVICEARDVKGLYAKARKNQIANFTGISSPYEAPLSPDLILHCGIETPCTSLQNLLAGLSHLGVVGQYRL